MFKLVIQPLAEIEIAEAANWFEGKVPDLGIAFVNDLEQKLQLVRDNPYLFQVRYKNVRMALLPKFQYAIHYIIEDKLIVILAVLNTKRRFK